MPTYGSLFSGVGGFDVGFDRAGFQCAFQCEIDKQARSVLARHWPHVTQHEDVREIGKHNLPPIDVLIGGFPCQDLSVAGQRKGLQGGTRSGLFYELARIAVELRPRFVVWENVPGLLSSDDGRDFARVLRHLGDSGFHGGWRVLDAEGFGVAQHRRRVFGVFTRERARIGCVAEILALRESVCRDFATSRETGKDVAADAGSGLEMRGVVNALTANGVGTKGADDTQAQAGHFTPLAKPCAKGSGGPAGDECQNLIAFTSKDHGADASRLSPTLRAMGHDASHANGGGQVAIAIQERAVSENLDNGPGGKGYRTDDRAYTLEARHHVQAVCASGTRSHSLTAEGHDASEDGTGRGTPIVNDGYSVRRLTPRECERLMGWPDDWTRYAADGREVADGPRYRMAGNGVVASVSEWIARRMIHA